MRWHFVSKDKLLNVSLIGVAVAFVAFRWLQATRYLELFIAWVGFSPVGWIYKATYLDNFARDFPSGFEVYGSSAFMHIYKLLFSLGHAPESVLPVVIAFELIVLSLALYYLTRTLLTEAPPWIPFLVIILTFGSNTWEIDISRFGAPFLVGQYYNVADAFGISAIAAVLRSRIIFGFLLLALSYVTHPIVGITCLGFIAGMLLVHPRKEDTIRVLAGFLVFLAVAGAWTFSSITTFNIFSGSIPLQEWTELSRLCNYHWYPIEYGHFTVNHHERFIPFLSFFLLFIFYITRNCQEEAEKKVLAGMAVVLALTAAGIIFSAFPLNPTVIKISLQRAQRLVTIIGLAYVVKGLWEDCHSEYSLRRFLAMFTLISASVIFPGYPAAMALLLCFPAFWELLAQKRRDWGNVFVLLLASSIISLLLSYKFVGISRPITDNVYSGIDVLRNYKFLLPLVAAFITASILRKYLPGKAASCVVIALVLLFAGHYVQNQRLAISELEKFRSYKEAQIWARENTSTTALFMVDPTIYYGWRDYSRRSSFGNLREWIHTGWLYDSNYQTYREGMERFNEFDIDLRQYTHNIKPGLTEFDELTGEIRKRYYAADDSWRQSLSRRYGIDYFLVIKTNIIKPIGLPVAYENQHFIIYSAPSRQAVILTY